MCETLHCTKVAVSLLWTLAVLLVVAGCEPRGGVPTVQVREAGPGLKVDGILSKGEWGEPAFQLGKKQESGAVFLTWKSEGLAIAFTASDSTPAYGGFEPGTSLHRGDLFEIFVDPVGDHRQYYEIQIDPSGRTHLINHVLSSKPEVLKSLRFTESFLQRELWSNVQPEPAGMQVKSGMDTGGRWTLELFLPASGFLGRRLESGALKPSFMRMNFCRVDARKDGTHDLFVWAEVESGCQHISPQAMGRVHLVK
jgi:hypothetical protein